MTKKKTMRYKYIFMQIYDLNSFKKSTIRTHEQGVFFLAKRRNKTNVNQRTHLMYMIRSRKRKNKKSSSNIRVEILNKRQARSDGFTTKEISFYSQSMSKQGLKWRHRGCKWCWMCISTYWEREERMRLGFVRCLTSKIGIEHNDFIISSSTNLCH